MKDFFYRSEHLDRLALRPLSHITTNWELSWDPDNNCYKEEDRSFAKDLNQIIKELEETAPPINYHEHEDVLIQEFTKKLNYTIQKKGNRWDGDYVFMLEQGAWSDYNESTLLKAAAGRVNAAKSHAQIHFDDMEDGHQKILAYIIAIILHHRWSGEW